MGAGFPAVSLLQLLPRSPRWGSMGWEQPWPGLGEAEEIDNKYFLVFPFHIVACVQHPHCPDRETKALQEGHDTFRDSVAEPVLQPRSQAAVLCVCVVVYSLLLCPPLAILVC